VAVVQAPQVQEDNLYMVALVQILLWQLTHQEEVVLD
jgi:hypothetical protein